METTSRVSNKYNGVLRNKYHTEVSASMTYEDEFRNFMGKQYYGTLKMMMVGWHGKETTMKQMLMNSWHHSMNSILVLILIRRL